MDGTAPRPERLHEYRTAVYETTRWDGFTHRAGDIFVCTPPKCGTTWTQMICALLVHQRPDLPMPLTKLSRWVERATQPIEEVEAEMSMQAWRRVLKSHTPLDGLPYFEDASYVVCGRDPRDAFLSMMDHFENLSPASIDHGARRMGGAGGDKLPFPTEPNALFPIWQTAPDAPWTEDGVPFGSMTHFMKTWWAYRRLPNITFIHYADMMANLDQEMRRLASFLSIEIDETVWPRLVSAASFEAMKDGADAGAPGAHLGEWKNNTDFFRRARMGEWRTVLNEANIALYERLSAQRLDPALKAWLEGGRAAADPQIV